MTPAAWLVGWALSGLLAAPSEGPILAELERLDQSLGQAEASLRQNEGQRRRFQEQLAALQTNLASAKVRQHQAYGQYRNRVRALARLPDGARWALLGGASSLEEYLDTARLLRRVAAHDKALHDRYETENQRLRELAVQVRSQRDAMDGLIADSRTKRDALATDRSARADLLRSVRAERSRAEALAREKQAAQEKLRRMVAKLEPPAGPPTPPRPPSAGMRRMAQPPAWGNGRDRNAAQRLDAKGLHDAFARNRGHLPWPAAGALRVAFGQRVELVFGTVTSHNGWDIGAHAGSRVQAVASGQVVYAGWLRGYGQMVIVDHGDGYHSVAAHLASIDVQVGDAVTAGQWIGTVGDTGSLRGTVLYFEIRHKGVPVDPRAWLKR